MSLHLTKTIHDRSYRILLSRLKTARLAAGLTQAHLARKLGTQQPFISRYERAERRLDVIEFRTICTMLRLDHIALLNRLKKLPQKPHRSNH